MSTKMCPTCSGSGYLSTMKPSRCECCNGSGVIQSRTLVQITSFFEDSPVARRKWSSLEERRKSFLDDIISLGGQFVKAGPDDGCLTQTPERSFDRFFSFPTEDVETVRQLLDSTTTLITVYEGEIL